jgi:beta-glucanase (GH16 family)
LSYELSGASFSDDYHLFTLEWDTTEFRWYVDNDLYQTQNQWYTGNEPYPAPFDKRFHLLLNVAVGGNWPGNPNMSTQFPQYMHVDYVRVYKRDE